MPPRRIGLIGAECTGKSALATALAAELDAVVVPEYLRTFVTQQARTPAAHEQYLILWNQSRIEDEAAGSTDQPVLIADPAPLMTAIYSRAYFDDSSLMEAGVAHARGYDLVVWCLDDIPWVADGHQRDGVEHRARVQSAIRDVVQEMLSPEGLTVLAVSGDVSQRVEAVRRVWLPDRPLTST